MKPSGEPPDGRYWDRQDSNRNNLQGHESSDRASRTMEDQNGEKFEGKAYLDWLDARNIRFQEEREAMRRKREEMERQRQEMERQ